MRMICMLFVFACLLVSSSAFATDYYVYCVKGKIEVDSRDPAKMQSDRGDRKLVTMGKFNGKNDADNLAKKLGGPGAKCSQ